VNADLIAKIKKLRALATSTNVNEAANAAAAAERLIAEHQLSEADLATETVAPGEACEAFTDPLFSHDGERRTYWKEWLAAGLARLYGVVLDCTWVKVQAKLPYYPYTGTASRVGFTAIGTKSDVELLRYQYAYLSSEIERLAQAFLDGNSFARGEAKTAGNSFRVGAVEGVIAAMREARGATVVEHSAKHGSGAALVLVSRRDAAVELHKKLHPDKYKKDGGVKGCTTVRSNCNGAAREAGRRAGAALHSAGALAGGASRQLGGGK
jgi:hypothetical protein